MSKLKIIPYRDDKRYPGVRFRHTFCCQDCNRGASIIIVKSPTEGLLQYNKITNTFLIGLLRRLLHQECVCGKHDKPPSFDYWRWIDRGHTETFK